MTPYSYHNHDVSRVQQEARHAEREAIRQAKLARQASREAALETGASQRRPGRFRRIRSLVSRATPSRRMDPALAPSRARPSGEIVR